MMTPVICMQGLTLLPLLAAALLAPSAARASFLQGTKALPETFATVRGLCILHCSTQVVLRA